MKRIIISNKNQNKKDSTFSLLHVQERKKESKKERKKVRKIERKKVRKKVRR